MSYPFKPFMAKLELPELVKYTRAVFNGFPDFRKGAPQTLYTIEDAAVSAFSMFFMQSPSFLAWERYKQEQKGLNNVQSLFLAKKIPSDNWIRTLLDPVSPTEVFPIFSYIFNALKETEHLSCFKSINGNLLIPLDGTQYYSSKTIHCKQCSAKHHKNGTITYSHSAITPVIVSPDCNIVISLEPEFITPQDGSLKQDSENAAAKRWIFKYAQRYKGIGATILGDDLYSHQPLCQLILNEGLNFIFVCKPDSHKTLYEWVEGLQTTKHLNTVETKHRRGKQTRTYTYRFANEIPLRDSDDALKVNWCELTITDEKGKNVYKNSFISNHLINSDNVAEIVKAGRARWKIENENNNVLKTKGYHIEHNFGHGDKHLSSLLLTLNLLAFLFHTVLEMMDDRYQLIRQKLGSRSTFFDDIRALTKYHYFKSWDDLFQFMLERLKLAHQNTVLDSEIIIFDTG